MNERIRTLLIQAQDLARSEVENNPDIKPPYHIPATQVHVGLGLSYEKFAELIVRECIEICNQHPSKIFKKEWDADVVAWDITQRIKGRFGVEV